MSHLGERVTALVDGQLSADASERATMHLVGCRPCRDAVELERLTKHRLASLGEPAPGGGFLAELMAIGGPHGINSATADDVAPGGASGRVGLLPPPTAEDSRLPLYAPYPGPGGGRPGRLGRPATRHGESRRPEGSRPASGPRNRSAVTTPRLAAAALAAACFVGAGVGVGGAAAGTATEPRRDSRPLDAVIAGNGTASTTLPFTDVSVYWGFSGLGR